MKKSGTLVPGPGRLENGSTPLRGLAASLSVGGGATLPPAADVPLPLPLLLPLLLPVVLDAAAGRGPSPVVAWGFGAPVADGPPGPVVGPLDPVRPAGAAGAAGAVGPLGPMGPVGPVASAD